MRIKALALALLACACSASNDEIHAALGRVSAGLQAVDKAVEVTAESYAAFCKLAPSAKACTGKAAKQIGEALAAAPLAVGQIEAIVTAVQE